MNAEASETSQEASTGKPKATKAETVSVTMKDGAKRDFLINKKTQNIQFMIKDYVLADDGSFDHARFDFNNGEFRIVKPPQSLVGRFVGHGIMQKYGDELAGLKAEDGGQPDIDDVILTIDELDETIQKGEWSQRKEGAGLGGTSILIKALMEYSAKPVEIAKAFLKDKDAKFKLALRHNDDKQGKTGETMAAIVKRLEAAKAATAAKVDTSSALADLDSMGEGEQEAA
jgi:hypothetical protein